MRFTLGARRSMWRACQRIRKILPWRKLRPSDFTGHPWNSVTQKTEAEIVARNIMVICARLGDRWGELTWDEYAEERSRDGDRCGSDRGYFDSVYPRIDSAAKAVSFSPTWAEVLS